MKECLVVAVATCVACGCSSSWPPSTRDPEPPRLATAEAVAASLAHSKQLEEDRRARRHNEALYAVEAKEAEHERRLRRLSADARRVLTADEISLFVDDPRPGVRTFAEGLKLRGAAMNKVVAADHRHQSAKEALASKQRQLVGELADSDPNAEVVGRSIARRLKGEVDAIVTVWLTIYQENGWEQPLSPAVIAGLLSDAVVAQATDDVLARRAAK